MELDEASNRVSDEEVFVKKDKGFQKKRTWFCRQCWRSGEVANDGGDGGEDNAVREHAAQVRRDDASCEGVPKTVLPPPSTPAVSRAPRKTQDGIPLFPGTVKADFERTDELSACVNSLQVVA